MKADPRLIEIFKDTILWAVRRDERDLSARQLAVLLICRMEPPPHTVRGLAERLGIPKPSVTRAADRLEDLKLAKRQADPRDRRSVLIATTPAGRTFVQELQSAMELAAEHRMSAATSPLAAAV
jgi:DNA-binding MarR family transcriptional regulator